jgi:hypothetical protein
LPLNLRSKPFRLADARKFGRSQVMVQGCALKLRVVAFVPRAGHLLFASPA